MSGTQKKILVFAFVAFGLWRLFEIPAVANAFWEFCTVGALPGTDRTVSPELVLKMLIMAFPLSLLLIFRKEFLAATPWRRSPASLSTVLAPVKQRKSQRKAKSPVVIVLPVKVRTPLRVRIAKIDRVLGVAMDAEARFITKSVALILRAARGAGRYLWVAALFAGRYLLRATAATARTLLQFWRFIEPTIREFDHWLEITLHQSKTISSLLNWVGDLTRFVSGGLQKLSAYAQRYIQHRS